MKKNIALSVILIASSIITLNSCKKKTEVDNETQSVVDNAICEQQFMAIQPVVNEKGIQEKGIKRTNGTGGVWNILGAISGTNTPNVATDTIVDANGFYQNGPVTFEIDYGTTGTPFMDGTTKYGKMRITALKRWSYLSGNQITVDLVSFKSNNVTYSGQIKITRPDTNSLTVEVVNGHCSDGSWNIDYAATKTMTKIAGTTDDYSITGNSSGKNRDGRNFTTTITNPIVKKASCKWITSGTLDLTPDGFKTRTVDFGNGTCDDDATYTVNGQTVSFKLK
jgi:hypothetical protein